MKIRPLFDRVVIKSCEVEETTKSGLILTGNAKEKPQMAEVIAVGPGGVVDGKDVTIIATGIMVPQAMKAAEALEADGISARVIDMHTIKPLDAELVVKAAKETGCIVTAEEHSIIGGLGGAVCELLSEVCPTPVLRLGVNDEFGRSGKATEVLDYFGLNAEGIAAKAREAVRLK